MQEIKVPQSNAYNTQVLLYSTGNYIQSLVMENNVRKKMCVCIYICMCVYNWVTLQQKLTEHCISTLTKHLKIFKKNIFLIKKIIMATYFADLTIKSISLLPQRGFGHMTHFVHLGINK